MELQGTFITRPKSKTSKASSTSLPELSPNLLSDASPSHSGTATPITPRVAPRADGAIVHCISVSTYVRSVVLLFLRSLLRTRPDFRRADLRSSLSIQRSASSSDVSPSLQLSLSRSVATEKTPTGLERKSSFSRKTGRAPRRRELGSG